MFEQEFRSIFQDFLEKKIKFKEAIALFESNKASVSLYS